MKKHEKAKLSDNSLIEALPLGIPETLLNNGRCATGDEDPRLWDLAVEGEGPRSRHYRRSRGADLCKTECPVRKECLEFAHATRLAAGPEALTGVWGGIVFSERDMRGRDGDARFRGWPTAQLALNLLVADLVEGSSVSLSRETSSLSRS